MTGQPLPGDWCRRRRQRGLTAEQPTNHSAAAAGDAGGSQRQNFLLALARLQPTSQGTQGTQGARIARPAGPLAEAFGGSSAAAWFLIRQIFLLALARLECPSGRAGGGRIERRMLSGVDDGMFGASGGVRGILRNLWSDGRQAASAAQRRDRMDRASQKSKFSSRACALGMLGKKAAKRQSPFPTKRPSAKAASGRIGRVWRV